MTLGFFEVAVGLAVVLVLTVFYYLYHYLTQDYWSRRGVKSPKLKLLFSAMRDFIFGRCMTLAQYSTQVYKAYRNEPLVGLYVNQKPILMVRDPNLIKYILVDDFSAFSTWTPMNPASEAEPLAQHLFFLELCPQLKQKISSKFSPDKLGIKIFPLLKECIEHLGNFLEDRVEQNPVIECRDLADKFTIDAINFCAFGLDRNAMSEEESEFQKLANHVFKPSFLNKTRLTALSLLDLHSSVFYDERFNDFFIGTIIKTMEDRRMKAVKRNDFIDLLLEIKDDPNNVNDIDITDSLLAAQAFAFFIAGFKTSSEAMSHTLYELAQNQSIQDKLREDIIEGFRSHNDDLTYEAVKYSMYYLKKVFLETLRKYPPVSVIQRSSLEPYSFVGTNVTIPKDTQLWIPAYAIQHDPKIYPEPEKFDPKRFDSKIAELRHPSFYVPFGTDPRKCIGINFGMYQTKVGLIQIVKNYKVEVCDQTRIDPKKSLFAPLGDIKLKFTRIMS